MHLSCMLVFESVCLDQCLSSKDYKVWNKSNGQYDMLMNAVQPLAVIELTYTCVSMLGLSIRCL